MSRFSSSWVLVSLSLALLPVAVGCGGTSEAQEEQSDPAGAEPANPDPPAAPADPGDNSDPVVSSPDAGPGEEDLPPVPVCPVPPTFEPFVKSYAQAVCEGAAGCCKGDNLTFDIATCVDEMTSAVLGAAQCVTVDIEAGDRCIAAMKQLASECSPPPNLVDLDRAGCAGAILGTVEPGGVCRTTLDCASPADGQAYCMDHDGDARCVAVHYATQEGAACDPLTEPEAWECDPHEGLYCNPGTARCETIGLPGGACAETYSSEASCVAGTECWLAVCEPLGQPGDPCGLDKVPCEGRCDKSTNTCVALQAPGESCVQHDECGRGATCSSGVCVPESYYLMLLSPAAQCRVSNP